MVNKEIPTHYTASPSSLGELPHLTINRDSGFDQEESNHFEGPEKLLEVWFAPSAAAIPPSAQPDGLKAVSFAQWTEMLDEVHCKVLSVVDSEHVDAYLLSESSMFIFPHKVILKTCGTTTLLSGLPTILEIAALSAGFPHTAAQPDKDIRAAAPPFRVFYSRKNFLYPDQQQGPHRSWRDEVRTLDRLFPGGSAYMIGKMNADHWYLYITEPATRLTPPLTPDNERIGDQQGPEPIAEAYDGTRANGPGDDTDSLAAENQDETLEILMTDLDVDNAKQFYMNHAMELAAGKSSVELRRLRKKMVQALGPIDEESDDSTYDVFERTSSEHGSIGSLNTDDLETTEGHALGAVISEACGLADIYPTSEYPDAKIDAFLFTPCGFSANGVVPAPLPSGTKKAIDGRAASSSSSHYFTVHVTPEPQCSYASFETNVPTRQSGRETVDIVKQVVDIFKPGRFSVTLFEAKGPSAAIGNEHEVVMKVGKMDSIEGYRRLDRIVHDLDGYELVFRCFERLDWLGGPPRLGEQ